MGDSKVVWTTDNLGTRTVSYKGWSASKIGDGWRVLGPEDCPHEGGVWVKAEGDQAIERILHALNGEPDPRVAELEKQRDKYKAILSDCLKALRTNGAYDSIPDHIARLVSLDGKAQSRMAELEADIVERDRNMGSAVGDLLARLAVRDAEVGRMRRSMDGVAPIIRELAEAYQEAGNADAASVARLKASMIEAALAPEPADADGGGG